MSDYEKLGAFYLGRTVDAATGSVSDDELLYDSRDLTTHAVIIGMTGSGKTGLGVGILEEAAMDGVPVIAIDPKGDLANLLLSFPDLAPGDFRPWVNADEAARKGIDIETHAAEQAQAWRDGLAQWEQDGERIRRMRANADFAVYTPGSTAGLQISVLRSFDAPPRALLDDADGFRDRVQSTVTGLLGLLGIDADPVRSREHILLSSILNDAWSKQQNLDLGAFIQAIQQPAFTRIGVMELESVYPAKERFELAMQLNGLLASPGFQAWMEGEPLDIASLLYTAQGRPRVSVISIAHLGDAERMFFVTMLMSAVVAWMRTQAGTTSLRAIVYMDEIAGYFPPVANPPSKAPMLTLLKQARAFGIGMVLATQNPVDLDYKGLGNTGTWFIGRLQTDRDKQRVLEALDGAMTNAAVLPREQLDRMLSALGKRVFLMHNVHRGAPVLFTTRWTMSYLAGPLTLAHIRTLAATRHAVTPGTPPVPARDSPATGSTSRPVLPADIRQFFMPSPATTLRPAFFAGADIRYSSAKHGVDESRTVQVVVPLQNGAIPFATENAVLGDTPVDLLDSDPADGAAFASLPAEAAQPKSYTKWGKELIRWIQASQPVTLFESKLHKAVSQPGETERDFRIRIADIGREARDAQADKLRAKYEPRFRTLEEKLRRAEQAVEKRAGQSRQAALSTGLSAAGAVLGAVLGGSRKKGLLGAFLGAGTSRATTAIRTAGRAAQSRQDVAHAEETVEALQAQTDALEAEFQQELQTIQTAPVETALTTVEIRPALNAISLKVTGLLWMP